MCALRVHSLCVCACMRASRPETPDSRLLFKIERNEEMAVRETDKAAGFTTLSKRFHKNRDCYRLHL